MIRVKEIFKENNKTFMIACICIGVFSLFFTVINPLITLCFFLIFTVIGIFKEKRIVFDLNLEIIITLVVTMTVLDIQGVCYRQRGVGNDLLYTLVWPLVYICGKFIAGNDIKQVNKRVMIVTLSMVTVLWGYGVVNYINGFRYPERISDLGSWGNWPELWLNRVVGSRGFFEFAFMMMSSIILFAVITIGDNRQLSTFIIIANVTIVVLDFICARGRWCVVLQIFCLLVTGGIYLLKNNNGLQTHSKKVFRISVIAILMLFILTMIAIRFNINNIGVAFSHSFLARDGGIIHNVRFQWMMEYIYLAIKYPKGGWLYNGLVDYQVHNSWLSMGIFYDSLVVAMFMIVVLSTFVDAVKMIVKQDEPVNYLLFSVYLSLTMYFALETSPGRPGFYRNMWVFLLLINGMIHRKNEIIIKENK